MIMNGPTASAHVHMRLVKVSWLKELVKLNYKNDIDFKNGNLQPMVVKVIIAQYNEAVY